MFVIKNDLPVPEKAARNAVEYPFGQMTVGSYFEIPLDVTPFAEYAEVERKKAVQDLTRKLGTALSGAWRKHQEKNPTHAFLSRTDLQAGVVRVFRIDDVELSASSEAPEAASSEASEAASPEASEDGVVRTGKRGAKAVNAEIAALTS
jgi:hypothetical protein